MWDSQDEPRGQGCIQACMQKPILGTIVFVAVVPASESRWGREIILQFCHLLICRKGCSLHLVHCGQSCVADSSSAGSPANRMDPHDCCEFSASLTSKPPCREYGRYSKIQDLVISKAHSSTFGIRGTSTESQLDSSTRRAARAASCRSGLQPCVCKTLAT